jgi:hypothetical protein
MPETLMNPRKATEKKLQDKTGVRLSSTMSEGEENGLDTESVVNLVAACPKVDPDECEEKAHPNVHAN